MAENLAQAGHRLSVVKTHVDSSHPRIAGLMEISEHVEDYYKRRDLWSSIGRRLLPRRWAPVIAESRKQWLSKFLTQQKPHLAVVSQGQNFDGLDLTDACRRSGVPYVLIAQKAADSVWPLDCDRELMQLSYVNARRAFFVSHHNRNLTELQIGVRLTNAEVVANPFLTAVTEPLAWPEMNAGEFKLACVARVDVSEKGQDVLLQTLALDHWKARPLSVTFFGQGEHTEILKRASGLLGLKKAHFAGFTSDIVRVWKNHHALVLPSRCEGLPLTVIEAMLCGRPTIVTNVGGNAEIVEDNHSGFVAGAATVDALDEALERAWARRDQWQAIGKEAAASAKRKLPADPCAELAVQIMELID
ncbi:MAG: glycosyltransferase family 4 protein [Terriglobales bacterium]